MIDYKEYSRLRSIARKRIERAAAAGLAPYTRIPTVKEVKTSANPEVFLREVKAILNEPSTVREIRKSGSAPERISFPELPEPKAPMSAEEKRARRNEQKRRSKAKRAVEKSAPTDAEGRRRVGYLKALETVSKQWREAGVDVGNWLGVMSPGMSKKFVAYMEYRFSQGDYKNRYAIDTFIKDFGTLVQKGYDFKDIKGDFDQFLIAQKALERGQRHANKYGITYDEVGDAWHKFVDKQ